MVDAIFSEPRLAAIYDAVTCFAYAVLGDIKLFAGDVDGAVASWDAAAEGFAIAAPGLVPYAGAGAALALAYGHRRAEALERATTALHAADRSGCPTTRAFARFAAAEASSHETASRATDLLNEAIDISESVSGAFIANVARLTLATLTARQGRPQRAVAYYPALLHEWRRSGQWAQQWNTLRTLVPILTEAGACIEAATLLGGLHASAQADSWGDDQIALEHAISALQLELGDRFSRDLELGASIDALELVAFAEGVTTRLARSSSGS